MVVCACARGRARPVMKMLNGSGVVPREKSYISSVELAAVYALLVRMRVLECAFGLLSDL